MSEATMEYPLTRHVLVCSACVIRMDKQVGLSYADLCEEGERIADALDAEAGEDRG